jgi:hypothetical protein
MFLEGEGLQIYCPRRGAPRNSFESRDARTAPLRITAVTRKPGLPLTLGQALLTFTTGGRMKDIHEVLRQKQTRYAQLGKQIEMLQQAAEKLREVAPLLAENDDEDNTVLTEVDEAPDAMAAKAGAGASGTTAPKGVRPTAPRWP